MVWRGMPFSDADSQEAVRRKLAAVRPVGELIRSVYGVGYRLDLAGSADASP